jgi:hypothetical protein
VVAARAGSTLAADRPPEKETAFADRGNESANA